MHTPKLLATALLMSVSASFAATPGYLILDHSTAALLDKPAALAVWKDQIDDKLMKRLVKLYPVGKFGFISQVEGGFTADKTRRHRTRDDGAAQRQVTAVQAQPKRHRL